MDSITDFATAMERAGLGCPDPIRADGKLHRFTVIGDTAGSEAGWYVLHLDFPPSGAFGSFKTNQSEKWNAKHSRELTQEEREELKKRMAADRVRKHREEAAARVEAARRAREIWAAAVPCPADHPYLNNKGIQPHIARVYKGQVTIPVTQNGELVGLQFIAEDGEKTFLRGTPSSGSYALVGDAPEGQYVVCEGYATACTIHEATGLPVFAAYYASNLEPVALALRARIPDHPMIIAADDDRFTKDNPGIKAATIAAASARARVARPAFRPGYEGKPTDFNDMAGLYGLEEVKRAIFEVKPKAEIVELQEADLSVPDSVRYDPLPDLGARGPRSTISNLAEILRRVGARVRYNVIAKEEEILFPNQSASIDNQAAVMYARVLDVCARFGMPVGQIPAYISFLADQSPYNPVSTWVLSKPWDGISRLADLYKTITARHEELELIRYLDEEKREHVITVRSLKSTLIRRWMVSAVAGAFRPGGVSAHGVLVFQGDQYLGKTKWFKNLVPQDLGVTADGKMLKPDDRDSVKQVISYWLVELGELDATFKKADIAQLKAFLTKDRDTLRTAYAVRESNFVRRTVFFASVNQENFLADDTGNRRFWTIGCEAINYDHDLDMQQIWAEVHELYLQGESWYLSNHELSALNQHNIGFEVVDPIDQRIRSTYNWSAKVDPEREGRYVSATGICEEIRIDNPSKGDVARAASVVRKLNGGRSKVLHGIRQHWVAPRFM